MEQGFEEATSQNLPVVDMTMVANFYRANPDFQDPELRNVKTSRATEEKYGDNAVGYVQIRRVDGVCIVKARVTPEHKVHQKGYAVYVEINEELQVVVKSQCLDCSASQGGCKHSIALVFWLYRKFLQPSVTSVECYWKKSKLAKVGTSLKFATLKDLCKKKIPPLPTVKEGFRDEVVQEGKRLHSEGVLFQPAFGLDPISKVCLHKLSLKYSTEKDKSMDGFINFIKHHVLESDCHQVEKKTREQRKSPDWFKVRFGRITASKLFEASRCKTIEGSLTTDILGGCRPIKSAAVERGKVLEDLVLAEVCRAYTLNVKKCGFFISQDQPIFGASPDGLTKTHVLEIKCPFKDTTVKNYVDEEGNIANKPYAQMQLQMHITRKKKGYFCIAAPDFETSKHFQMFEVDYNQQFVMEVMESAKGFWKKAIYSHLMKEC